MTDAQPTPDRTALSLALEPEKPDTDAPSTTVSEKSSSTSDTEAVVHPPDQDVAPDGGYGWVCVACIFMINAHTWGINCSYGIFLSHYLSHNTYPGASPLEYAFIGGLSIAMSQAVAPAATYMIRRWSIHAPIWLGIVLQTASLLGASWSTSIWQLFLSQGICFGLGLGFVFNGTVGIIPQWFSRRRSFANSIGTAGSGVGGLIYSLATGAMIRTLSLPWAFRILGIVSCVVCAVAALLLKDRNAAVGAIYNPFDARLLRRPQFLLTLAWGCFSMVGYINLLFTLPNYAVSIGLTAQQASIVGAMLNLGQGVGRPLIGYFSDALGRINMCLLCTAACGVLCFAIWIPAQSYGVLILFALLGGGVAGTLWTTVAPVTAEVMGLRMLPSALSLFWVALIVPSTFAEVIGLELRREGGDRVYLHAQVFTGVMFVAAAGCLWFVRAWKVGELEEAADAGEKREREIRDDDEVPRSEGVGSAIERTLSVRTVARKSRGLWLWTKV